MRFVAVLLLALSPPALGASEAVEAVEDGLERLEAGRYRDAIASFEAALAADPNDATARVALARARHETGEHDEAAATLEPLVAGEEPSPEAARLLIDVHAARGRRNEALAWAERLIARDPKDTRALLRRGELHRYRGQSEAAVEDFKSLLSLYNRSEVETPGGKLDVAIATIHLAELSDARVDLSPTMRLLDRLTRDHPRMVDAWVAKGDLLVKWQKDVDARKEYRTALKVNSRHAGVLRGMAESFAFRSNFGDALAHAHRALQTNPNLVGAIAFLAGTKIGDYEYDEARELIDRALAVDAHSKEVRALLAAMAHVRGDDATFAAQEKAVLAIDPTYGALYHHVAQILETHRRFEEAIEWARKAIEIDPRDWGAAFTLGRNLLNVGREKEAYELLDRAERLDPYPHVWRRNYLELFDSALSKFLDAKTEHFVLRFHVSEFDALRELVGTFMEKAYRELGAKYGYEVKPPILVEVFHRHDDFAARTIGMPGLGALGACFGPVITLDSPSARDPGTFSWASTAWHELAHSITLGLSDGRVPRWLTEGLSVYEERCWGPEWERRMERELFDAYHNDELPAVAHFNAEFRSPRVMFAYYLGGLMSAYIAEAHGFEKIPAMLKLYARDQSDEQVFTGALGVSTEVFDAGFRAWVGKRISGWALTPRWSVEKLRDFRVRSTKDAGDFEAHVSLAEAFVGRGNTVDAGIALARAIALKPNHPRVLFVRGWLAGHAKSPAKMKEAFEAAIAAGGRDFDAQLSLARMAKAASDVEAAKAGFEKAKELFPFYVGEGNPYVELSTIAAAEGDLDTAMKEREAFVNLVETEIGQRIELATWYDEAKGDLASAEKYLRQAVYIYPLDYGLSVQWARVLRRQKRWADAGVAYRMVLELERSPERHAEIVPATVLAEAAEVTWMLGDARRARDLLDDALKVDPSNELALKLLDTIK